MYYNFSHLINKYSTSFTLISTTEGAYNDKGDFIKGATNERLCRGAIIGFRENKLYRESGTLTTKDKHLLSTEPLGDIANVHVRHNGNVYKVEEEKAKDNALFTGVYSYVLKWVSAFD